MWIHRYQFTPGVSDGDSMTIRDVFYGGDTAKKVTNPDSATYSGRAFGLAYENTPNKGETMHYGTASLNLSGSNAVLSLQFPTYYNFTFNSVSVASGAFNSANNLGFSSTTGNPNPSAPRLNLFGGPTVSNIQGQFYGNNASSAEAVGKFQIEYAAGNGIGQGGMSGAFGVKK